MVNKFFFSLMPHQCQRLITVKMQMVKRVTFLSSTSSEIHSRGGTCIIFTGKHHSHNLRVSLIKFHPDSFFLKIFTLWERLSRGCFPDIYSFGLFISRVNLYLSYTLTLYVPHVLSSPSGPRMFVYRDGCVFSY